MTTPTPITDHIRQGLARLLTPYRDKPRFAAWCAVQLNQVQYLENAAAAFLSAWDVDTCDLPRLTVLGKIVGQSPRGTLEQFRSYVKVRILVNRSRGRAPDLIKIASLLLGTVTYSEGACRVWIESDGPLGTASAADVVEFLHLAKMSGVQLNLIAQAQTAGFLLGDDTAAGELDSVHGLSDEANTDGGYLGGIW